ncbi:RNA-directed DNA polymerase [Roseibium litorale]|uniref:RNA-directed DNA polymerase n=1 Tax=Roseibium litorale TaxID=2803841 RepID=A0ABR9CT77_9HYPH|nr:RNA-directed DNA polymerase [Roseibium litorale]MBD8894050.1 RNA-directed DNA polymerase [Roseibium litorale]
MRLPIEYFNCAVEHIAAHGDTDIFPYPLELKFLQNRKAEIAEKLSLLDLNDYHPMSLVESLVPKSKFGFRAAHQPFAIDTVIYTALVLRIFDAVEEGRDPLDHNRAFSYRKKPGLHTDLFHEERTYRDWLELIKLEVFSDENSHVIRTDISDYYSRIYRHRLENILISLSGDSRTVKKIESFISDWRSRQSFGLPVGSNASRLLAEAALNDTDMGLISEGYNHTRYVDDMLIFVKKGQDPYAALGYLAKQLTENEGLSLNIQKTRILTWDEFISSSTTPGAEDDDSKEKFATEKLFWAAYGHDDYDKEALKELMLKDLCTELEELLNEPFWDMGRIRIVLHAMRLVKSEEVAKYVRSHLSELIPFAKDVCLLIEEFMTSNIKGFEDMNSEITDLLLSPRMRPLDCARAWFLELGVRKHISFDASQIRLLESLSGTLDLRQLHLLRWRAKDLNFFRSRKTRVHEIQPWAQPTFIFGASCLPKDEYSHWLRSIKSRIQFPLGQEFVEWCNTVQDTQPLG